MGTDVIEALADIREQLRKIVTRLDSLEVAGAERARRELLAAGVPPKKKK